MLCPAYLAADRAARRAGVRGLPHLAPLILPGEQAVHMRGCKAALDIVFVGRDSHILAIFPGVRPGLHLRARPGSHCCVEFPAGEAERLGLRRGETLSYSPLLRYIGSEN